MLISFQPGQPLGDVGDLGFRCRRLDKQHVGAGLDDRPQARSMRGVKSFDRNRVGARDDDEIGIVQARRAPL